VKEANAKLIGVFVIGGVLLLVGALVLFSSQDLFTPKRQFVAYFQQSVNGLNVGAPVRFRGIPIGKVISIDGIYDPETGNMTPRLVLEVRPEKMANVVLEKGEYTIFASLVENGMRASLKSASLLTGQLYVALDFHPGTPVRQLGTGDEEFPEMPTIDSGFDEALAKLSDLPLEEVLARAAGAFAAAEKVLRDPNIGRSLESLVTLLDNSDETMINVRGFVDTRLTNTFAEADKTLASARASLTLLTERVTGDSLQQVDRAMYELEQALKVVQQRLGREDPLNNELLGALREIAAAARSASALADFLEEHPEALLKGKNEP